MSAQSVLKMENLYFDEIKYNRDISVDIDEEYQYRFERNINQTDSSHYIVSLKCFIKTSNNESVNLEIRVTGWFCCDEKDENTRDTLIRKNAVAIIFPYLRSQISLVTTQPNMCPIMLPTMNINALFDD